MAITGKAAEDILERIFQPTTKPSARDQAEETLRHPKRLVYVAMSNRSVYWRAHIQKFVLAAPVLLQLEIQAGQLPDQDLERALARASLPVGLLEPIEPG